MADVASPERTLPHNLEAERSVLGAILLHNDAFNFAAEVIDAQDFAGEPIATIRLPVRVPFGFHGGWAPDVNPASVVA